MAPPPGYAATLIFGFRGLLGHSTQAESEADVFAWCPEVLSCCGHFGKNRLQIF